ncbi:D-glycerate dehydrogenase [Candidatus Poribacteria bacterium]|nr:D-glycerate dehydrogenase [Candidatus Poribacteria bacterium]
MKVFITRPIPAAGLETLRAAGLEAEMRDTDSPVPRAEFLARLEDCSAAIVMLTERIDAEVLDRHPQLRIVANFAVGINNLDVPECTRRGVALTNTPDVLTDATADLAWGLLLSAARRIVESDQVLRSGAWDGWGPLQFLGCHVSGKTLGIIGPGRIGRAVARRGRGFDMRVVYYGTGTNVEIERECGAVRLELDALLAEADFLSIHCPLTPGTRHLIGAREFARMRRTAVLVNTSRGPVVDESALVTALRNGTIAAAGLDVYEDEPRVNPGLLALPNAVLAPHIGSATHQTRSIMAELCARNIVAFARGERPPTILNPEVLP